MLLICGCPPAALPRISLQNCLRLDPRPDPQTVGQATDRRSGHGPWSWSVDRCPQFPASISNDGRPARTVGQSTVCRSGARSKLRALQETKEAEAFHYGKEKEAEAQQATAEAEFYRRKQIILRDLYAKMKETEGLKALAEAQGI
uniref:Flotillin-1 n=1 Tax=Solanum tuberosum TaxID=4113 RepID=M1E0U6_SOLTU